MTTVQYPPTSIYKLERAQNFGMSCQQNTIKMQKSSNYSTEINSYEGYPVLPSQLCLYLYVEQVTNLHASTKLRQLANSEHCREGERNNYF